jgi:outer membrane protein assembly factor BamB
VLNSPSTAPGGVLRAGLQAFALTAGCRLSLRWQRPFDPPGVGSAPMIAGGVLYIASGRDGWVRAFRLRDGAQLWARRVSSDAIFAAPAIDHGMLLIADWGGVVSAWRA